MISTIIKEITNIKYKGLDIKLDLSTNDYVDTEQKHLTSRKAWTTLEDQELISEFNSTDLSSGNFIREFACSHNNRTEKAITLRLSYLRNKKKDLEAYLNDN